MSDQSRTIGIRKAANIWLRITISGNSGTMNLLQILRLPSVRIVIISSPLDFGRDSHGLFTSIYVISTLVQIGLTSRPDNTITCMTCKGIPLSVLAF
jgi:hypothetical protein